MTDLTFIEDGIPSVIKKTNLINFAKRAKTAEVIRDIQQYQNVGYSLQPVPELHDYIVSNMQAAGDVHEMYDKSLQIEPREREDEKIVRYVQQSKAKENFASVCIFTFANELCDIGCLLNLAFCEILAPEHQSPDSLILFETVSKLGPYIRTFNVLYNAEAECIEEKHKACLRGWKQK